MFEALPELSHNAVVGFEHPAELRRLLHVVFVGTASGPRRIDLRAQITAQLLDQLGISHDSVEGELERVMSSIYLGDYVSYYLALLNRVDPTQIEAINVLKEALARS